MEGGWIISPAGALDLPVGCTGWGRPDFLKATEQSRERGSGLEQHDQVACQGAGRWSGRVAPFAMCLEVGGATLVRERHGPLLLFSNLLCA